jgi:hypothetical protein
VNYFPNLEIEEKRRCSSWLEEMEGTICKMQDLDCAIWKNPLVRGVSFQNRKALPELVGLAAGASNFQMQRTTSKMMRARTLELVRWPHSVASGAPM